MTVVAMMPSSSAEYHPDDQSLLVYSSDDSGCVSDAYFLSSPPREKRNPPRQQQQQQHQQQHQEQQQHQHQQQRNYGALESESLIYEGSFTRSEISESILEDNHQLEVPSGQHRVPRKITRQKVSQTHSAREQRKLIRRHHKEQEQREQLVRQVRGKAQPEEWRDVVWLVLFCIQILAIIFCAIRFGRVSVFTNHPVSTTATIEPDNVDDADHYESFQIDYKTVIEIVGITGMYACILSTLTVGFMLILAKSLIQSALIFTMLAALAWACIGLAIEPYGLVATSGFCALCLTLAYTLWVWDRIPFAATNLHTALCAMRGSSDILLMGMGMLVVTVGWCIVWSLAFIGIVDTMDAYYQSNSGAHVLVYIVLVFSLWWTNVVIKVSCRCGNIEGASHVPF